MKPGEKMGLGIFALAGLCCGGLPAFLLAGPAIAGVLSGSWPVVLAAATGGVGVLAYRRHCRSCKAPAEAEGEVIP